ncbi:MAG: alpha/beta hydrolase [Anaerolineaceae bacterium]|nr:alpha/beta hydrolase [Anaerolineaceae bacterium]
MHTKGWIFFLALLLTACQGGTLSLFGPTPTPFPELFTATVDLGEYQLPISCKGSGEPTIILESGLGGGSWGELDLMRFRTITRACFYDRWKPSQAPDGVGGPRTTMDQVTDLHNLLQTAGVPGPYILVGHSLAGSILPLYANLYPEEVVGLVCVDCWSIRWEFAIVEGLEAPNTFDPDRVKEVLDVRKYLFFDDWRQNPENLDIRASYDQAMKVTDLGDIPFVTLVASDGIDLGDQPIRDWATELWKENSQELCDLSSNCRYELVEGVDHWGILLNEAVDQAVREVYDEAKEK